MRADKARREARRLARSLEAMVRSLAPGLDWELGLSFVQDEEMRALNEKYMGADEVTDVLSFPMLSAGELASLDAAGQEYPETLGDIVIDIEAARRQAEERDRPLADELRMLAAHGLLHLFGYTHDDEASASSMAAAEAGLAGRSIIEANAGES